MRFFRWLDALIGHVTCGHSTQIKEVDGPSLRFRCPDCWRVTPWVSYGAEVKYRVTAPRLSLVTRGRSKKVA